MLCAQFFCINDRISYPINSPERQQVILEFWEEKVKPEHNLNKFYIL